MARPVPWERKALLVRQQVHPGLSEQAVRLVPLPVPCLVPLPVLRRVLWGRHPVHPWATEVRRVLEKATRPVCRAIPVPVLFPALCPALFLVPAHFPLPACHPARWVLPEHRRATADAVAATLAA